MALATELRAFMCRPIAMFRISIVDTPAQRRLVVEGRLSGLWVAELRTTYRNVMRDLEGRRLVIDLSSLTVISREGEDAIVDLMKDGAKFSCAGVLTRHVLKRLARRCRCEPDTI
jgi:anti-anti-sigma regulatory factor